MKRPTAAAARPPDEPGASGINDRLAAAFLIGLALFLPPLLTVFSQGSAQGVTVGGIPLLYVYLFGAWLGLIVLLAAVTGRSAPHQPAPGPAPPPPPPPPPPGEP